MIRAHQTVWLALLFSVLACSANAQTPANWKVSIDPIRPVNGSPVLFRVTPPVALTSLTADWMGHKLSFRFGQKCSCWYALGGVALSEKPGSYPLHLIGGDTTASRSLVFDRNVVVAAGRYPSTTIKVAPEYVEPPKELTERIQQEEAVKKKAFAESAPESLWLGRFAAPTNTEQTGVFGSARLYNGVKRHQHAGQDFRAAVGTPVHATNAGKVALARGLYFEGNCVMVDHGGGLMTIYMHLSEFHVKEGDVVEKGQLLGLSGGTGRVTGPHLHFAVRWQGIYLDPATLLKLNTPQ
jgi:murein DD-endopeptidase MepM/ murein hydrolase activator NlpD